MIGSVLIQATGPNSGNARQRIAARPFGSVNAIWASDAANPIRVSSRVALGEGHSLPSSLLQRTRARLGHFLVAALFAPLTPMASMTWSRLMGTPLATA